MREYLGVPGQGVTGLLAAANLQADPGQVSAQLTGAIAIAMLALVGTWVLMRPLRRFSRTGAASRERVFELLEPTSEPGPQHANAASEPAADAEPQPKTAGEPTAIVPTGGESLPATRSSSEL